MIFLCIYIETDDDFKTAHVCLSRHISEAAEHDDIILKLHFMISVI